MWRLFDFNGLAGAWNTDIVGTAGQRVNGELLLHA